MKKLTMKWKRIVGLAMLPTVIAVPLLSASGSNFANNKGDDVVKPDLCEPYPECVIYQRPESDTHTM
ncbi:hypothetical protein JYB87_03030 [Shewanella avicenniae]|uniref:Uncharacterized protein n=1 Tax=Shewanella avicenniae TaxID=2814294 RepID=A0ABX7QS60_9GAMM|nr:hypothetical protein [Shewanella avicenniae]QSX34239.1 hypothetical protein JYB87_03030 [Shewanella avicenniae]